MSALERPGISVLPLFRDPEPLIVIASTDENEGTDGPGGPIYSRDDADVTPPRSVYPKLPREATNGPGAKGRTVLELIVATNGLVERVRLQTAPRDIHEFMFLSAAKAWRFEPATVAGRPVRFLQRISITGR
jgi:outer membrane biosynthesis protein TonB